ncbi:hypothetical protein C1H71_20290 (plasmid) [Iodobacter fluviatilis]|uniref:Uncharacterized protein n=2 Tax=Iodobacter fluviatilis TaxID=537 RepID=A0A7G3GG20_9NEIS|nr:hypothetical protein C1H71_20290 [Iodobacter fluviatilis]
MGGAGNSAELSNAEYPLCDEGFEVLQNGAYATTKQLFAQNRLPNGNVSNNIPVYMGSELKGVYSGGQNGRKEYPSMICVKKPVSATFVQNFSIVKNPNCANQCGNNSTFINRTVMVVDDVVVKSAYQGGFTVDVTIEGKLFKRVNSNSED